jgi:hypothetical protein
VHKHAQFVVNAFFYLGASEDLSGLESRDQMASGRIRDGLLKGELAEEARGLQL